MSAMRENYLRRIRVAPPQDIEKDEVPLFRKVSMAYDENTRRLHVAIVDNDLQVVKRLIKEGASVIATDKLGKSALHWAVVFGNRGATQTILKHIGKGAGVNIVDRNGCTALHYAAMEGRSDIGKILMSSGAKIDEPDKENMTPLHYAAQTNSPIMIQALVRKKANRMVLDGRNLIPYHVAQQYGASNNVLRPLQPDKFEAICSQIDDTGERNIKLAPNKAQGSEKVQADLKLWIQSVQAYNSAPKHQLEQDSPIEKVRREMTIEADISRRLLGIKASPGTSLNEKGTQTASAPPSIPAGGVNINLNKDGMLTSSGTFLRKRGPQTAPQTPSIPSAKRGLRMDAVKSFVCKLNTENLQPFFTRIVQCFKSAGNSLREHSQSISSAADWGPINLKRLRAQLAEGGQKHVQLSRPGAQVPAANKSVSSSPAGNPKPRRKPTPYPLNINDVHPTPAKATAAKLGTKIGTSHLGPVLKKRSMSPSKGS